MRTGGVPETLLVYPHAFTVKALAQSEPADKEAAKMGMVKGVPRTVIVVEEKERSGTGTPPELHRAVQGRVAGPVVQLRFISLFPWSSATVLLIA